jgi:hypothetical protein
MCFPDSPAKKFYQDLPEEEQEHWVSVLEECPAVTQFTAITQAAYLHHPITYLYCESDAALPFEVQKIMVQMRSQETGIDIRTETCTASHSPFLSQPERVLEVAQKVLESSAKI